MIKKTLIGTGIALGAIVLVLAALVAVTFAGRKPIVDAGNDPSGQAILAEGLAPLTEFAKRH